MLNVVMYIIFFCYYSFLQFIGTTNAVCAALKVHLGPHSVLVI